MSPETRYAKLLLKVAGIGLLIVVVGVGIILAGVYGADWVLSLIGG